jgi:serine acetyltransferase
MHCSSIEYIYDLYHRLRALLYTMMMSKCFFKVGQNTRIDPPMQYSGLHRVTLGSNIYIGKYCWLSTVPGNLEKDILLNIHDNTMVSKGVTIAAALDVTIEDNVTIGPNSFITDHIHEYEDITRSIYSQGIKKVEPVLIGRNTWLGYNVIILPGTKIGRNCVIGANAVVNADLPDYTVAVGMPAKIVKRYDPDTKAWINVSR